jgi:hypothetical protein
MKLSHDVIQLEVRVKKSEFCREGYDYTNMTAPLPVCPAKLSMLGLVSIPTTVGDHV